MSSVATESGKPYRILTTVHEARWDEGQQRVLNGWAIRALWLATRAVVNVFVPDDADLVSTADTLIQFQGQQLDRLTALGS